MENVCRCVPGRRLNLKLGGFAEDSGRAPNRLAAEIYYELFDPDLSHTGNFRSPIGVYTWRIVW